MEDKEDNNEVKEHKTVAYVYKHDDEIINKYIEQQLKRYYDILKKNGMSNNKPTNRKQRRKSRHGVLGASEIYEESNEGIQQAELCEMPSERFI